MFSESVAQKPMLPVSAGTKNFQNWPAFGWPGANAEGCESIGPKPPAVVVSPPEQCEAEDNEQRRFDFEQNADAVNAFVDDPHVDTPEDEEADELRRR